MTAICLRCPCRQRACAGTCPCTLDGVDIHAHAAAGYCPEKRFGDGIKPPGWDAGTFRLPIASDAEIAALFERDKLGGCGCDPPASTVE